MEFWGSLRGEKALRKERVVLWQPLKVVELAYVKKCICNCCGATLDTLSLFVTLSNCSVSILGFTDSS